MTIDKDILKAQSSIDKYQTKIDRLEEKIQSSTGGKLKRLEKQKAAELKMLNIYKERLDMLNSDEYQYSVNNSVFSKIEKNLEKTSEQMQSVGKGMTKAGLHTTAAVWTPAIYLGYRGVKHLRNKPKNESVEQDLIELIKEVEQAYKEGKITEEQKREYVINFVDEFYRK